MLGWLAGYDWEHAERRELAASDNIMTQVHHVPAKYHYVRYIWYLTNYKTSTCVLKLAVRNIWVHTYPGYFMLHVIYFYQLALV